MNETLNGLTERVSILEQDKDEHSSLASDMLHNNQEIDFDQFFHDGEYIYPNFDYQSMYMDAVNLMCVPDEQVFKI
jgi:hypothetical protein